MIKFVCFKWSKVYHDYVASNGEDFDKTLCGIPIPYKHGTLVLTPAWDGKSPPKLIGEEPSTYHCLWCVAQLQATRKPTR
jgi:hypothetical protein